MAASKRWIWGIFSVWSYSFNMTVVKGISRKVPWEKVIHVTLRPAGCFKPPVGHGLLRAVPEKSAGGHQIDPKAVPLWQRPSFWLSHTDRLRVGQLLGECSSPNLDAFVRKKEITGCHLETVIIPEFVWGGENPMISKKILLTTMVSRTLLNMARVKVHISWRTSTEFWRLKVCLIL